MLVHFSWYLAARSRLIGFLLSFQTTQSSPSSGPANSYLLDLWCPKWDNYSLLFFSRVFLISLSICLSITKQKHLGVFIWAIGHFAPEALCKISMARRRIWFSRCLSQARSYFHGPFPRQRLHLHVRWQLSSSLSNRLRYGCMWGK